MKKNMKGLKTKIALDDLKVQSFVTSLNESQKNKLMGGEMPPTFSGSTCTFCQSLCSNLGSCC